MAKPDWGALQDQFLAEHAKTDISPKDWCEEQELNYTSARRYITKPPDSDTTQESAGILKPQHEQYAQSKEYYIDIQPAE